MAANTLHSEQFPAEPSPDAHEQRTRIGWWPSLLGLGAGLLGGGGDGTSVTIASVVAVIALIYVAAAVTDRPPTAWWSLLVSIPVVLSGRLAGVAALPFLIMAALALALIIIGWRRGTWARACNRLQLYALAGFGAIAVAGALTDGTVAALLIAGGLIAHAAWDAVHLVRRSVVGPRYAELCAVLDAVLGLTILWGLL
ncbi:hypothetical protein CGZ93_02635 [Enemella dayhoffiae]|uniref:Uncharacterized protein n=1 Tax=Enemella dayhoffiae TaxID=2016507 RepID=A0A255HAK2_9ACTN|nr:hypothetical protein [Enemella dayhoffiae]OYO24617.1 hypothetical protein CGZ93_02635 [Enemella dayhoffiae]